MFQMKGAHIDYFPIRRALALRDEIDEDEVKQMDELKTLVQSINDRLAPLEEYVMRDQSATGNTQLD